MSATSQQTVLLCKFIPFNADFPHFIKITMHVLPEIYGCISAAWDIALYIAGIQCVCACAFAGASVCA